MLLVRRSQVIGDAEDRTKTKARLRIPLPAGLMEILQQHVKALPSGLTEKSDLLFPSKVGGYQTASVLTKPIVAIAEKVEIKKQLSPYFMRRTFQDLCRAAQVHDFVARSISGHATVEMQQRYSSVNGAEVRDGLAKVISLAGFRSAQIAAVSDAANANGTGDANAPAEAQGGGPDGLGGDRSGDRRKGA